MTVPSSARATDRELMRRVQGGDAGAFAELFDRLAPRALRVARSLGLDSDRAEDAVQEAFLTVWRARTSYRPDLGMVSTWVLGVTRNRSIDTIRRHARHDRRRDGRDGALDEAAGPGSLEAETAERDEALRLRALLTRLPLAQREVIALAYFGQCTQAEIAETLSLPLGTVKGRMRLGLEKLRGQIPA